MHFGQADIIELAEMTANLSRKRRDLFFLVVIQFYFDVNIRAWHITYSVRVTLVSVRG